MKPVTKIQIIDDNGEKFFGEGPCRLLRLVEETGSLRCAAASMEMAYSKALKLIKQAEGALGFPLTQRTAGGKDGGGSTLTPEGRAFLRKYEAYGTPACRPIGSSTPNISRESRWAASSWHRAWESGSAATS